VELADQIEKTLEEGKVRARRLRHGYGLTTWSVIESALARGSDTRVGLEDTIFLPDGTVARNNRELIQAAVSLTESLTETR
jgi:uncharacterized protein (DUF849 family)